MTNKHSNFPSPWTPYFSSLFFQSEFLKNNKGMLINDKGIILIDTQKELISENLWTRFQVTISFLSHLWQTVDTVHLPHKRFIRWLFPSKMVMHSRNYFLQLFCKILLFSKKLINGKYSEPLFPTKKVIFFVARRPRPFKLLMFSHKWFFLFFPKIRCFRKICLVTKYLVPTSW